MTARCSPRARQQAAAVVRPPTLLVAEITQLSDLPQSREEHEIGWPEPAVGSRHHLCHNADAPHPLALLCPHRERPRRRRAAEQRDELAPFHRQCFPFFRRERIAQHCRVAGFNLPMSAGGSFMSHRCACDAGGMSAVPPTELAGHATSPQRAMKRHPHQFAAPWAGFNRTACRQISGLT